MKNYYFLLIGILLGFSCTAPAESSDPPPNILLILADDLGYGDIQAYQQASKIPTPHLNRLAEEGRSFTDAHSSCAVCTPTRYGLMTGRYSWRGKMQRGVLLGYGPTLIEKGRTTMAGMLQEAGYHTGVIGKWHLGVDWAIREEFSREEAWAAALEGKTVDFPNNIDPKYIDFQQAVSNGPNDLGFDYSYILPASLDFEPYCYLKNQQLVAIPDSFTPGNDLNTGYTGAFWRKGRIAPGFEFEQVLPTFIDQAKAYLGERKQEKKPFFLYLPLAAPHTPWVPTAEYESRAQAGAYGDFVHMVDAKIGELLAHLDALGLKENTLVIFTSDNGPFWKPDLIEQYGHRAAGSWKGMKADIWEGGHRVPFILRWPGKIPAGSSSDQLLSLTDVMASCAAIVNREIQAGEAEDSYNLLPAWLDRDSETPLRQQMIQQSSNGTLAIRHQNWKYIPMRGSGGFSKPKTIEPGPGEPTGQLYDLQSDPAESQNLFLQEPQKVAELSQALTKATQSQ